MIEKIREEKSFYSLKKLFNRHLRKPFCRPFYDIVKNLEDREINRFFFFNSY